jgi:hypothetical protein
VADMHKIVEDLKTARDETKLKIHLGSEDGKDEWAALELACFQEQGGAGKGRG